MLFRAWIPPLLLGVAAIVNAPRDRWASAGDLLPADRPLHEVVDHYIDLELQSAGVSAAPQADDANLARRLYLDLAGRTPTMREARAFADSTEPDKRLRLVRRLMQSPDFARHQRNELDLLLSADDKTDNAWRAYLLEGARENKPWDQLFRELLLTEEQGKQPKPELSFLRNRGKDIDRLTTDVSSLFFGVNISCAKCHDHPLVADWKQDHFFGMQSFFNRTFVSKANFVAERSDGDVTFKTTSGESKKAQLMFLTGLVIDEPAPLSRDEKAVEAEKKKLKELDKKKLPPPPPVYSRREQLVEAALAPQSNRFFSRSVANRLWHRLFGHGLVNPVDQMHSENPPTHPALLDWLARDTASHHYDLRRLIEGLVMSQTYSRGSRWPSETEPPMPDLFAVARVRPLSPRQYALSLIVASSTDELVPVDLSAGDWDKRLEGLENRAAGFARQMEPPSPGFQVSVNEALWFSNNDRFANEFLRDSNDRLLGALKKLSDPREQIELAVWSVLSRPVQDEEAVLLQEYLAQRKDRPIDGLRQMLWALLASTEFRFNH